MSILAPEYTVFAGENTWNELFVALRSLLYCGIGDIRKFENEFSNYVGVNHAVTFGAGRMALFAILRSLGITAGDEVVLQAFTCNVVPRAIIAAGGKPVYTDININDFNVDVAELEKKISNKTKAIILQHTFGVAPDIERIQKIIGDKEIAVIEDCAHAFKPAGIEKFKNQTWFSFFSTDHTKPINTHVGGVACTNSDEYAIKIRALQDKACDLSILEKKRMVLSFVAEYLSHRPKLYPFLKYLMLIVVKLKLPFVWPDNHKISENQGLFKFTDFQAKLGLSQIKRIHENIEHRKYIFNVLEKAVGWYGGKKNIPVLRYPFLVRNRSEYLAMLDKNVSKSVWFDSPVSGGEDCYAEVQYEKGSCPNAENVADHIVNISVNTKLPKQVVDNIVRTIRPDDVVRG